GGSFLALDLQATSGFCGNGPRHLVFSVSNDIFVQPFGLNLVQGPPPSLTSATLVFEPNGARAVALAGSNLNSDTKFYFDGVPGTLLRFDPAGRAVVAPPPGIGGLRAAITAFNLDGQNSMFLNSSV